MSIVDLIGEKLRKVTAAEWAGPCPGCGGDDRFRVWPGTGRYWCRGCSAKGDEIQYRRDFLGQTYEEAASAEGKVLRGGGPAGRPPGLTAPRVRVPEIPEVQWQRAATAFVVAAHERLWNTPEGKPALELLRARGLSDATLLAADLGYNPEALQIAGRWWVEPGVTIPWVVNGAMAKVNVRLTAGGYKALAGSKNSLYRGDTTNTTHPVALVESELDCLSVLQAANDLVVPVATGSNTGARHVEWFAVLALAPLVLVAFDADAAGDKGAAYWLDLPNARRLRPVGGKDANDMLRAGTLRPWISAALA